MRVFGYESFWRYGEETPSSYEKQESYLAFLFHFAVSITLQFEARYFYTIYMNLAVNCTEQSVLSLLAY